MKTLKGALLTQLQDNDLELLHLIRHFELALLNLFSRGKLHGTTHTCLGQEYIPVALKTLLLEQDFVLSNHRGHGHYLTRYLDPEGLLAEIMGKEGAICNGVGGSQHIHRTRYLSTGVEGESLPVAVGVALHMKMQREHGLAVVHIGDGTWGEGAVYEALNIAQLWQVPLLVIVENNTIAQTTPLHLNMAGTIEGRVLAFGVRYSRITSFDINIIREMLALPIQQCREQHVPLVVEFETQRLGPHSKGDDTRSEGELELIHEIDWYTVYRQRFPEQFAQIEATVQARITRLVAEVEMRPLADYCSLLSTEQ